MKRLLIALFCAAMLLPHSLVQAESPDVVPAILMLDEVLDQSLHVQSIAASKQRLYIKSLRGLHRWQRGDTDASLILPMKHPQLAQEGDVLFHQLLSEGDTLYGLNTLTGMLYPLADDGGSLQIGEGLALAWSDFREDAYNVNAPRSLVLHQGFIWGIHHGGGRTTRTVRFDLKDGSLTAFKQTPALIALTPEKDGAFLSLDASASLFRYQPDSGSLQPLGSLQDSAWDDNTASFLHHPGSGMMYWLGQNALYRGTPGENGQKIADLIGAAAGFDSPNYGSTPALVMVEENLLAALTSSGICLFQTQKTYGDKVQVIILGHQQFAESRAINKAAARLNGISLQIQSVSQPGSYCIPQTELMQRLLSRDDSVDIFVLDSIDNNLRVLIEKGYAENIAGDDGVKNTVNSMYSAILEWVTMNEGIYALPVNLETETLSHSPASFNRLQLTVPADYFALCDFYQSWAAGLYSSHAETLLNLGDKRYLKRLGYDLYVDHVLSMSQELRFDSPLFRRMMEAVDLMDTRAFEKSQAADNPFFEYLLFQGLMPFQPSLMHQVAGHENNMPLILKADAGLSPALKARVTVLMINPFSQRKQEAAQVIAATARSLNWETRITLMPDAYPDGVLDPAFEEKLAMAHQQVKNLQERVAAGENVAIFTQLIETEKQRIADADSALKYLITAKERQEIREMMAAAYVPGAYQQTVLSAGLMDLFFIYLDGSFTLEQFIKEADNRLALMTQEGQ